MRYLVLVVVCLQAVVVQAVSNTNSAPDFDHLYKTALLASATYEPYATAKSNVEKLGWELVKYHELPQNSLQYLLLRNQKEQVIAVRGTANADNVLVDLDLQLILDNLAGIHLHQGFSLAAQSLWQDVKPLLKKDMPIRTTGHSLGGAVSVVLAMYLSRAGYSLTDVTTYGQPKVTNVNGAKVYEQLPLTRVVTPLDIVPIVPPLSPLELKRSDIYWHNGEEIILLSAKTFARVSGIKSMLRASKFIKKVPDETNVKAHEMQTYLILLKQNRTKTSEVPYKMELNFFGLSIN